MLNWTTGRRPLKEDADINSEVLTLEYGLVRYTRVTGYDHWTPITTRAEVRVDTERKTL